MNSDRLLRRLLESASNPMDERDHQLIETATRLIRARYTDKFHQLASAGIGMSGQIYHGLQMDAKIGQASVCAEVFVMNEAEMHRDHICVIATVRQARKDEGSAVHSVSPCGHCRERLLQFSPEASVIIPFDNPVIKVPVKILLPAAYALRKRGIKPDPRAEQEWIEHMRRTGGVPSSKTRYEPKD